MTEWIAWEDKKPEHGKEYLVVVGTHHREGSQRDGGPVVIAEYSSGYRDDNGMWSWEDGETGYYNYPCSSFCKAVGTFWMPLPEPPPKSLP